MAGIIDVVASRVSRNLTREKLGSTFKPQPTTARGLVLGKQLAMIKGTPTPTTLDDEETVQTVVEFNNIGRPAVAVWSPGTSSTATMTSSGATGAAGTTISATYVPAGRRVNTVLPLQGGGDLGSGDLTLSITNSSMTAAALNDIIVPSATIDTAIVGDKLEFNVVAGSLDADTLDGYHAAEIMAAVNQWPDGTTTGDILRWDNVALEWVVAHEPLALAGAILSDCSDAAAASSIREESGLTVLPLL